MPTKSPAWDVAFVFRPLSGVSGDFYDFYSRNGQLRGVSLFDVSGHGIGPGLVTLLACSIIHHQFSVDDRRQLGGVVSSANRALSLELDSIENYLTGIVLRFTGNRVEYVNAGHPDLLLRRAASGAVLPVVPPKIEFRGGFLGKSELETKFRTVTFAMQKDDALLLYSDGLVESRNAAGAEFGPNGIMQALASAPKNATGDALLAHVLERFDAFVGTGSLRDDLTVMVVKRNGDANADADYAI